MSKKLLPCPHCGKTDTVATWQDDIEVNPDGYWTVVCNATVGGCGAMCGYRPTEEEAIVEWNTRVERTCKGCKYEGTSVYADPCYSCTRPNDNDCYERVGE